MIFTNKCETLGIEFKSKEHKLIDCEFVEDISSFSKQIYKTFNFPSPPEEDFSKARGALLSITLGSKNAKKIICHIMGCIDQKDISKNTRTKSHEQSHFLHASNKLNLLEKKLKDIGNPIELEKFIPHYDNSTWFEKELVATIGGFYGIKRNNYMAKINPLDFLMNISYIIFDVARLSPPLSKDIFKDMIGINKQTNNKKELFKLIDRRFQKYGPLIEDLYNKS